MQLIYLWTAFVWLVVNSPAAAPFKEELIKNIVLNDAAEHRELLSTGRSFESGLGGKRHVWNSLCHRIAAHD